MDKARLELLDGALQALLEALQPSADFEDARREVVADMQQLVQQVCPRGRPSPDSSMPYRSTTKHPAHVLWLSCWSSQPSFVLVLLLFCATRRPCQLSSMPASRPLAPTVLVYTFQVCSHSRSSTLLHAVQQARARHMSFRGVACVCRADVCCAVLCCTAQAATLILRWQAGCLGLRVGR